MAEPLMAEPLPKAVVIGGGIAGLAAAAYLGGAAGGPPRARVVLREAGDRLGGKLRSGEVGGVRVDLGAESMLARRPEAVGLAREVGLGEQLVAPTAAKAAVWTRGALRPLPGGQLMGVPGDLDALAASGVLSAAGLDRVRDEKPTEVGDDVAIGAYVAERLGQEVVDRLVEPLLGGVYAGRAEEISLRAAVPQLLAVAQGGGSLVEGVHKLLDLPQPPAGRTPSVSGGPVFAGLPGGIGTLPVAVAEACVRAGVELRLNSPVTELRRTPHGWSVDGEACDAVVLAVPAPVAARLLAREAPAAAAELAAVEYAGMALVTMAFHCADLPEPPPGSGFLVPPVDGRQIKAATFSSQKWGWLAESAPQAFLLRTSLGRYREEAALGLDDAELVRRSLDDLREAVGLTAVPYATEVTRWPAGLPQYPVGHQQRVARIRTEAQRLGGLALAGAAFDGVGIPACVGSARRAADDVLTSLPWGQREPKGR
ncbi:oxygen-dependent protoporphyrinogen oxidase [Kitasatospora sp. GP30]|uniref:protoporphyrinogen oxidase n=1 Tax=Kitasatospora sp. GP30 TaxID=3035084 RepID=UPI000CA8AC94|nr:protoporphyrinogen oxidase [Kitasatospora sp. GP30]MDH6140992.1 oxygen-dependent protoporphyrinogen oxidase [Kitasatospora sp. GP30]